MTAELLAPTVPIVLVAWTEHERGWGTRPDGYSIHLSIEDFNDFYQEILDSRTFGEVPDCYSSPGTPQVYSAAKHVYEELLSLQKKGKYISSTFDIDTEEKQQKALHDQEEAKEKREAEAARKERVKAEALAKLTDEEKKLLGITTPPKNDVNRGWRSL